MYFFTDSEIKKLIEYSFVQSRKYHAGFLVSLNHGLRVSELLGLKASDFSPTTVVIRRLKGNKTQLQPIRKTGNPVWDESLVSNYFPLNVSRQMCDLVLKKFGRALNIPDAKLHMHVWRHTTAVKIYEKSKSLSQVQSVLSHKSVASSLIYLRSYDEQQGLESLSNALDDIGG